jgi:hypothetical protein
MAEIKPLKLTSVGGGEGKLEEFAVGDTLPPSMLPPNSAGGGKNLLINGNFDVWQRGINFPNSISAYTTDRWAVYCDGSANLSVQQVAVATADQPIINSNWVVFVTKGGTPTAFQSMFQRIEQMRAFVGKTFTFSFRAFGSGTLNIKFLYSINGSAGPSTTVLTTGITLNNDWSVVRTAQVTFPAVDCTPASIIQVDFDFRSAGTTTYISNCQLEAGAFATPFEHRFYGQELALCQRYYASETLQIIGSATASAFVGGVTNFPVTMRATPTLTVTNITESVNLSAITHSIYPHSIRTWANCISGGSAYLSARYNCSAEL